MNNLLTIVCMAFSIYYAFSAPTSTPAPTSSTKLLQQMIKELYRLKNISSGYQIKIEMQFLHPTIGEKNMPTEDLFCRAIKSIEGVRNKTDELTFLQRGLMFLTTDVNCTKVTIEELEATYNIEDFISQLLDVFKKYFFTSTGQS